MLTQPAPDFSDPIGLLEACHGRMQSQCDLLQRLCDYQAAKGADAETADAATRILRYFDFAAPHHHADEERDLFPALLHIPELRPLIQNLKNDHAQHAALWATLRSDLLLLTHRQTSPGLQAHSAPFIRACLEHLEIENREILPRARRLLDAATLHKIGQSMARRRKT